MYGALDISTSGLVAQRTRLNVVAANLANKDTILNAEGEYEPYRRRFVTLATGDPVRDATTGVHVDSIGIDDGELTPRYEPGSPWADPSGYVYYPNVQMPVEQINAMAATRAYEANITAIEATKSMINVALQLLA
ncbi:MAG: flagellar basal body rod protein FlgC [Planctomycetota bacterium]|jgi:flagellar basal-body rod protein FlgC